MIRPEKQRKIEKYIRGELSANQINELWIEFIREPELYDYFNTYLHLIALAKDPRSKISNSRA